MKLEVPEFSAYLRILAGISAYLRVLGKMGGERLKHQTPISKLQRNFKLQAPNVQRIDVQSDGFYKAVWPVTRAYKPLLGYTSLYKRIQGYSGYLRSFFCGTTEADVR